MDRNTNGLEQARHVMHAASQVLAAAAHALATQQDDFSHTTLRYDAALGALVGAPLAEHPVRLAVRFSDVCVLVLGASGEVLARVPSEGRTLDALRDATRDALATHGVEGELPWLSHDLPAHALYDGGTFPSPSSVDLGELEAWFQRAGVALAATRAAHASAGPVRCWPHHFDTAVLIAIDAGGGETARSVGVGMSPGDGQLPAPYWYVSPWPPPKTDLPPLALGRWHREGFTAAVLGTRGTEVDGFLVEAIAASLQVLQAAPSAE